MIVYEDVEKFLESIGNIQKCDLHLELYVNNDYDCICGEKHSFNYDSEILAQGAWKLILGCPNDTNNITCVKLKSKFLGIGFSGFKTLST